MGYSIAHLDDIEPAGPGRAVRFVRRELAGSEELTGRDVIVLHRLAKNSAADVLGTKP